MNGRYSVAIDGPSGAGKSSLAKRCAAALGFVYADTGAIYRTVGLAVERAGVDRRSESAVAVLLPGLDIKVAYDKGGEQRMYLNGEDVSALIRRPEISILASDVSALPAVRAFLLEMQRKMARENNIIMDGRDIGTVVLPQAQVKIFLTASAEARAERRLLQLKEKGIEESYDKVLEDIRYRDAQDSGRAAAPLRAAEDAVRLDTSDIDFDESYRRMCAIICTALSIPLPEDAR